MTTPTPSRSQWAARGLGDHKHSSSTTDTFTAMAQSLDPSSTTPNLFPTTTAGRGDSSGGPGSANVYYLVFLGVLVIIMMLAACLAFRAFRMRRRYRTATQIALARGDPLPMQLRDDYWGLAGLPGFPSGTDTMAGGVITGERGGKKGTWTKIPILEEAEVGGMAPEYRDELFEDITPVTLHSLLAPPDPAIAAAQAQYQYDQDQAELSPSRTRRGFHLANLRRLANPSSPSSYDIPESTPRPKTRKQKEIDRTIQEGEDMRLAVVIQMPTQGDKAKKRQSWASDEEEEEVAWETGMELGVWEGSVGR